MLRRQNELNSSEAETKLSEQSLEATDFYKDIQLNGIASDPKLAKLSKAGVLFEVRPSDRSAQEIVKRIEKELDDEMEVARKIFFVSRDYTQKSDPNFE